MADLHLALKGEYFDAIKAGTKIEEYRMVCPFWAMRIEGREFQRIILTRGYPKRTDWARRLDLPWRGYTVKTITHPHFGNVPVKVYAINVQASTEKEQSNA
ncbi:ASCH domain-containing protein [Achromobacter ruhlandii]|uniref:ASCH domain-containing protein n=1 Tax=Achromobacter ruhlandii TaxID=72557 RepID=UPI003BA2BCA2